MCFEGVANMDDRLTIQEAAAQLGVSTHTLRYYEHEGLIQPVERSESSGHRLYSSSDLGWLKFLKCLRSTGMPIREIKRYADLYSQGESTNSERRALLEMHRERLLASLDELNRSLEAIDYKIAYYRQLEEEHTSVLQPAEHE